MRRRRSSCWSFYTAPRTTLWLLLISNYFVTDSFLLSRQQKHHHGHRGPFSSSSTRIVNAVKKKKYYYFKNSERRTRRRHHDSSSLVVLFLGGGSENDDRISSNSSSITNIRRASTMQYIQQELLPENHNKYDNIPIAAAALKRVTELMNSSTNDNNDDDKELAKILVSELLIKIGGNAVVAATDAVVVSSLVDDEEASGGDSSWNLYAISDTLSSLGTLATRGRRLSRRRQQLSIGGANNTTVDKLRPLALCMWKRLVSASGYGTTTPAIVEDGEDQDTTSTTAASSVGATSNATITTSSTTSLYQLGPKRLAELIRVASVFGFDHDDDEENNQLFQHLCQLLTTRGDVLGRLTAADVASTVNALLSSLSHTSYGDRNTSSNNNETEMLLLQALARRLRKLRKKASRRTLLQVLKTSSRALRRRWNSSTTISSSTSNTKIIQEIKIMAYTLCKELFQQSTDELLIPSDLIMLLDLARLLKLEADDFVSRALYNQLLQQQNGNVIQHDVRTLRDLSCILGALSGWSCNNDDPANTENPAGSTANLGYLIRQVGERFLECVNEKVEEEGCSNDGTSHHPRTTIRHIKDILRSSVFLYGKNDKVIEPYVTACRQLCSNPSFLSQCRAPDSSVLVWFLYRAHCRDRNTFHLLGNRILEPEVADHCSPSTASRILSTFTLAFSVSSSKSMNNKGGGGDNDNEKLAAESMADQILLSKLFETLGVHFLASGRLKPVDVSNAIHAYAKASYIGDMGIFDELAEVMSARIDEYGTRQIAQCLWACGKMTTWEETNESDDEEQCNYGYCEGGGQGLADQPPYVDAALAMAVELSKRSEELSTKDIAQSLWAISHLRIRESEVISSLAQRANSLSTQFTVQEVANILWALGKVNHNKDFDVVYNLTRRFVLPPPDMTATGSHHHHRRQNQPTPQECANILYALARLNIRDEEVFKNLTNIVLNQIDDASAQAIANTLWAHRTVFLNPPQQLIDIWATQKLGIVAIQPAARPFDLY